MFEAKSSENIKNIFKNPENSGQNNDKQEEKGEIAKQVLGNERFKSSMQKLEKMMNSTRFGSENA